MGIMLEAPSIISDKESLDLALTAIDQQGREIPSEAVRELLTLWAPAIAKGVTYGLLNSANPANILLAPYYKWQLIAELTSFAMSEVGNLATYVQLKDTNPVAAQQALDSCAGPFKKLGVAWSSLDKAQRVEMITQVVTEIMATGKVSKFIDGFMKSVAEETKNLAAGSKVLKGMVDKTSARVVHIECL